MSADFSEATWEPRESTSEETASVAAAAQCLRDAATLIEDTAAETDNHPWESPISRSHMVSWVSLMDPCHAPRLVAWLRDAADETEQFGADQAAVAFAQSILNELADDE